MCSPNEHHQMNWLVFFCFCFCCCFCSKPRIGYLYRHILFYSLLLNFFLFELLRHESDSGSTTMFMMMMMIMKPIRVKVFCRVISKKREKKLLLLLKQYISRWSLHAFEVKWSINKNWKTLTRITTHNLKQNKKKQNNFSNCKHKFNY